MSDRWVIYEALKGSRKIDINQIKDIDAYEIKEGVIEFLLVQNKDIEDEHKKDLLKGNECILANKLCLPKGDDE